MSVFERRQRVERALHEAANPDQMQARQALSALFDDHAQSATRELSILLSAITLVAGGQIELPYVVLSTVPPFGGLVLEDDVAKSTMKISVHDHLGAALKYAVAVSDVKITVADAPPAASAPAPASDYPAANPEEPEGAARVRICNAIRTLVQRHYDGEVRARGMHFMERVNAELLAMAVAIRLANTLNAETPIEALLHLARELAPRVANYQAAVEATIQNQNDTTEPGEPPPSTPNPTHLH